MRNFTLTVIAALVALTYFSVSANALTKTKAPKKKMDTSKEKTITTPSGLKYIDLVPGTGDTPVTGQTVTVNYTGWLENGTPFDSNVLPQFKHVQPFSFPLGQGRVIKGWDEGVGSMKMGGKRKLIIPPNLAYGDRAMGNLIPANSTLIFEVELKSAK